MVSPARLERQSPIAASSAAEDPPSRIALRWTSRMIKAVKFVSIPVRDQDKALEFYTKKLGLKVITDSPFDGKQRSSWAFRAPTPRSCCSRWRGRSG
jgi:hypothetical protein